MLIQEPYILTFSPYIFILTTLNVAVTPIQVSVLFHPVNVYREEEIYAPPDIGKVFAMATQDYQPQHISKWTAKIVGFSSPIAHGLWTMAVSIDKIMDNGQYLCFRHLLRVSPPPVQWNKAFLYLYRLAHIALALLI